MATDLDMGLDGVGPLDLAAAFGPILREAFSNESSVKRMAACEALAEAVFVRKQWFANIPTGEVLDRIEATIEAAERCMNASPFWDENSRYAGKALLDYPRSQIAAERDAFTKGPSRA
jgi:hypothetical protein